MSGPAFAIDTSPVKEENFSVKNGFEHSINYINKFAANVEDCIIAIGMCSETFYGTADDSDPLVLCLHDVQTRTTSEVCPRTLCFATEAELLCAFAHHVVLLEPDFIVGYNTCGFDWRYLRDRVFLLKQAACDHHCDPCNFLV